MWQRQLSVLCVLCGLAQQRSVVHKASGNHEDTPQSNSCVDSSPQWLQSRCWLNGNLLAYSCLTPRPSGRRSALPLAPLHTGMLVTFSNGTSEPGTNHGCCMVSKARACRHSDVTYM